MSKVALFGGTSEGRRLALYLAESGVAVHVFVATGYGEEMIEPAENLTVAARRLDAGEMAAELRTLGGEVVIDATHPYAHEVTANIRAACAETGIEYMRLKRARSAEGDVRVVADAAEAAAVLDTLPGKVLLTVGSKELAKFTGVRAFEERLFARVLPSPEVVAGCAELGFRGRSLICMQGPFTREMNTAMLRMLDCRVLVTKDSGREGGTPEKLAAAADCGATVILISRPADGEGLSFGEAVSALAARFGLNPPPERRVPPRFPLFIPLEGRSAMVVGGGPIAARRVKTLLEFGAAITVVSPALCPRLRELRTRLRWREGRYTGIDSGCALIVAATDDREVNRRVGEDAAALGIPASIADRREESTFWFPAVVRKDNIVAGVVSTDGDHAAVKQAAAQIRNAWEGQQ